jgi:broad specificity phosphatase PhoE
LEKEYSKQGFLMKLFLVRHGETVWNTEKRYQGWLDSELTKRGKKQIRLIADFLETRDFEKIYSSDFDRAKKTAEEIKRKKEHEIIFSPSLREMFYGLIDGMKRDEIKEKFPEFWNKRQKNRYYTTPPKGESYEQLENRVIPLLKKIVSEKKSAVIVSHSNPNKAMIRMLLGLDESAIDEFYQPNECIYIFSLEDKKSDCKKPEIEYYLVEKKKKGKGLLKIPKNMAN